MKFNKMISTTFALSLLIGSTYAYADANTTTPTTSTVDNQSQVNTVDPHSLLYSIKELLQQVELALTFDNEKKADLLIKQANEKVNELNVLQSKNSENFNDEYSKKINDILNKTEQILKTVSTKIEMEKKDEKDKDEKELEIKQTALLEVKQHSLVVLKVNLKTAQPQEQNAPSIAAQQNLEVVNLGSQNPTINSQATPTTTSSSVSSTVTTNSSTTSVTQERDEVEKKQDQDQDQDHDQNKDQENQHKQEHHDNGLHLGQLKHHKEKEKEKHED